PISASAVFAAWFSIARAPIARAPSATRPWLTLRIARTMVRLMAGLLDEVRRWCVYGGMTQPPGDGRGPLRAGRRRPVDDSPAWWTPGDGGSGLRTARAPRDARSARSAPSQAPDINLPRRYTGAVDPGARAMRKVWW